MQMRLPGTDCARTLSDHECAGAFARYTAMPSGNVVVICKETLDYWLDFADDDPDIEPARLEFL